MADYPMNVQVLKGVDGVRLGSDRHAIAASFGDRYTEFRRTQEAASPTGCIDHRVYVSFDAEGRVEFLEVSEPDGLFDQHGRPIPLDYAGFTRFAKGVGVREEPGWTCVVPSLSLAVVIDPEDDGPPRDVARASIVSVGVAGYFEA